MCLCVVHMFFFLQFICLFFSLLSCFPNCGISINTVSTNALLILTQRRAGDELGHDGQVCNQEPQIHQEATCHLERLPLNCQNPRARPGQSIATHHHHAEIPSQKYKASSFFIPRVNPVPERRQTHRGISPHARIATEAQQRFWPLALIKS